MIVGITGTLGAGKGTVVEFLKERGFLHYSVRDFLTEEIVKRGLDVNRDNMIAVANDLRAKFGGSYIVEELYKKAADKGGDVIIESIRCVGEVEVLKGKPGFVLWAVDADVETRYARIVERGSSTDKVSFQDFVRQEEFEMENSDPLKQNLRKCIEMADVIFRNDWTIGELKGKVLKEVLKVLSVISGKLNGNVRPTWDEYFFNIAREVGKRSTCDRGSSGCVIARDKQILVTGYNGAAKGLPHCDDVGHQMKSVTHEDGSVSKHCVRTVHGEQNAICQAAKFGISLEGATLYYKMTPCTVCAKMIINCGIKRVVCEKKYHAGSESEELFRLADVELVILEDEVVKYAGQ